MTLKCVPAHLLTNAVPGPVDLHRFADHLLPDGDGALRRAGISELVRPGLEDGQLSLPKVVHADPASQAEMAAVRQLGTKYTTRVILERAATLRDELAGLFDRLSKGSITDLELPLGLRQAAKAIPGVVPHDLSFILKAPYMELQYARNALDSFVRDYGRAVSHQDPATLFMGSDSIPSLTASLLQERIRTAIFISPIKQPIRNLMEKVVGVYEEEGFAAQTLDCARFHNFDDFMVELYGQLKDKGMVVKFSLFDPTAFRRVPYDPSRSDGFCGWQKPGMDDTAFDLVGYHFGTPRWGSYKCDLSIGLQPNPEHIRIYAEREYGDGRDKLTRIADIMVPLTAESYKVTWDLLKKHYPSEFRVTAE